MKTHRVRLKTSKKSEDVLGHSVYFEIRIGNNGKTRQKYILAILTLEWLRKTRP